MSQRSAVTGGWPQGRAQPGSHRIPRSLGQTVVPELRLMVRSRRCGSHLRFSPGTGQENSNSPGDEGTAPGTAPPLPLPTPSGRGAALRPAGAARLPPHVLLCPPTGLAPPGAGRRLIQHFALLQAKSADSALLAREQETAARGERAAGASCKTAARKSYNLVKRKLNKTVRVARLREEEMLRDSASAPERSGPAAPAPELPVSPSKEATSGDTRPGAVEERPRAVSGAGPSADSRVSPAGKAQQGLTERYRVGSLLGRGGFGSVFAATRLSDGAPVAIKRVPRNRIRHWGELPNGTSAPLEVVLLDKVSTGFPGVVQLLEWLELPNNVVLVMERPEHSQDLLRFIRERGFLSEEVARELFRQVLEAVRHCTSCGVLHRDLKPENILVDLATGQAKLIDFGCGTHLQDTAYTRFAGTPSYSPPEWNHFGWYYGEAATVWSLGIVLHQMVCGQHPFPKGRNISWGQLSLPQRLSQDCKELIRWCLSLHSLDRPSLEDLSCDPWLQDIHHP
ncbi:serine/threonine-protein kinase pim-1-like [Corvus hawaiiensis]|uniref:serine/threonine-protein kinase pim-1-like n=1 Tax=Corvus hawaiiensis TaxID=134902 RepID=UPI002019857A|nr:serine/threonine-protein kinase pim-1-like [Corvus hawaiiensis]XP_048175166.1 serine/threonine-protein kinase pim-1-like [Corvus hawaiiensis]XP_048175167.1 serine/threonine-protein kinase pim-1-like [Corvus hawaiiensis]XP_048175168.1 serine/threonine-protein kinase pim-1-like [Corvus hawaiiensis]XP_048175172.1 serine/threonine-protein kinase pim-1-like [Corvus hawaiiensis]XP_048175173.1 serine/threonine-protein kinase pim-1-like [Corvus hawaiiensis]XP_048175178.1 serine/threonine-protein k